MGIVRRTCSHGVRCCALSVPICVRTGKSVGLKDNIRAHVLVNGSIEAALGLALLNSRTRRPALATTLAYLTYFNASLLHRQRALAN